MEVLNSSGGSPTILGHAEVPLPILNLAPIVNHNPMGPNDEEVKPEPFFEVVLPYARTTEEACHQEEFISRLGLQQARYAELLDVKT